MRPSKAISEKNQAILLNSLGSVLDIRGLGDAIQEAGRDDNEDDIDGRDQAVAHDIARLQW